MTVVPRVREQGPRRFQMTIANPAHVPTQMRETGQGENSIGVTVDDVLVQTETYPGEQTTKPPRDPS